LCVYVPILIVFSISLDSTVVLTNILLILLFTPMVKKTCVLFYFCNHLWSILSWTLLDSWNFRVDSTLSLLFRGCLMSLLFNGCIISWLVYFTIPFFPPQQFISYYWPFMPNPWSLLDNLVSLLQKDLHTSLVNVT